MLSIFPDMIEDAMEVFMDDFLVVGNTFKSCVKKLSKAFQRCVDSNLVLN